MKLCNMSYFHVLLRFLADHVPFKLVLANSRIQESFDEKQPEVRFKIVFGKTLMK